MIHDQTQHVSARKQPDVFDELALLLLNLVYYALCGVVVAAWWLLLFPMLSLPLITTAAVFLVWGTPAGVTCGVASVTVLAGWQWLYPTTFHRFVTSRIRSRVVGWWRYRLRWQKITNACGLAVKTPAGTQAYPRLQKVGLGVGADVLRVRMLPGHAPDDWEHQADALAHGFGATGCATRVASPGVIELRMRRGDTLADPIHLPHTRTGRAPRGGHAA